MKYPQCTRCSKTIGWVGLGTNTILMFMKGFVGLISGSQAMVADAMYSAKDLITSVLVIIGMKVSDKPLDGKHPYGHGKIEFILSLFVSVLFISITFYLFFHAVETLLDDDTHRAPHPIALWGALVAVGVNVAMYFYARCVATETDSPMVRTLSKHHYADATASMAVAIAIFGAHYLNMPWIDPLVAVFETIHLMYLGGEVFRDACKGLMDSSLEGPARDKMRKVVADVGGVKDVKLLRTRRVGQEVFVEIVVGVDPDLSVSEAFAINRSIKDRFHREIPRIGSLQIRTESNDGDVRDVADLRAQWRGSRKRWLTESGA